jgi:ABC-type glycerol-3-phosphate transport system substrate-binding protein
VRTRPWSRAAAAASVALLLGLGACGSGEDRPAGGSASGSASGTGTGGSATQAGQATAFPKSDANTVVTVKMRDFAFEGLPAMVKGPKVYFEATNDGPAEHEVVIVDSGGKELGEIEAFAKGAESKPLAIELNPGRYQARCLVKLGDRTHADPPYHMETSFTVE